MRKYLKSTLISISMVAAFVTFIMLMGRVAGDNNTARKLDENNGYEVYECTILKSTEIRTTIEEETVVVEHTEESKTESAEVENIVEEIPTTEETELANIIPQYTVDGMYYPLNNYLYNRLKDYGIEWWMPYALCTIMQESHFDMYAVSKNGKDYGYFQYRKQYWDEVCEEYGFPGSDIFDAYVQTDIYVQQTAKRIMRGLSIEECISCHKQSDWGEYDAEYVNQVMQWFDVVKEEIK